MDAATRATLTGAIGDCAPHRPCTTLGDVMPAIRSGVVTVLYLFDVAQAIDLAAVRDVLGASTIAAALDDKTAGPTRLHYVQPPVIVNGTQLGLADIDGFHVRVKFYDYGVISLMLTRPFAGSWAELGVLGQVLIENAPLGEHAARVCRGIAARVRPARTAERG